MSTSSTPSPSPSPTAALSPFEADPAVQALRAWAAQLGRTINSGHYTDAKLRRLMTSSVAKIMKTIAGGEVGYHYPGPLPFTPLSVRVISATERSVPICIVQSGYSLNTKTNRPAQKYTTYPIQAAASEQNGRWLVSEFNGGSFSCKGVTIKEPSF